MKPRINVLTLAIDNLEKAMAFYRDGLGLETKGITGTQFEHGAVVFFHLKDARSGTSSSRSRRWTR